MACFTMWSYVSLYIQTCIILPNLWKTAVLLMKRAQVDVDNEEINLRATEYVFRHNEIDQTVWNERKKISKIKNRFILYDSLVFMILVVANYLCFIKDKMFSQLMIVPFLLIINTTMFAVFACRLGSKVKFWTGAKPNMRLVYLHIFNTVV